MQRRSFVGLLSIFAFPALLLGAGCTKKEDVRCSFCGMKLDATSAWNAELVTAKGQVKYDTPRCAFTAWRTGKQDATGIRLQEFYTRTTKDGAELRFVVGSDVLGPMGPDLVPVDSARAEKFVTDHGGPSVAKVLTLEQVTAAALDAIQ